MKLPDDFPMPDGMTILSIGVLRRAELIESIVRDCAKVCDEIGSHHNDPFQSQRCKNAILTRYDLTP